jgi:Spy/CpxP family protein refolding chaperone
MRKTLLCTAFLGTALLAGGMGAAAAHEAGPGHRFGNSPIGRLIMARMGRAITLKAELNLTDEQQQAIKQTLQSHKADLAAAIKPAVDAHRALRDKVLSDTPDDASIRKAADELGKKIGDAAVEIAKVKTEVAKNAKLTAEQKKKIEEFRTANDASVDEFFAKLSAQ